MFRVLLFAAAIGITVYAVIDWAFRSKTTTPGSLNRWIWLAVIILIPIAGPAAWIILSLIAHAEGTDTPPPDAPRAPDDDPEYLRHISEKIERRKKREQNFGNESGTKKPEEDQDSTLD
jgi:hypothetical protein